MNPQLEALKAQARLWGGNFREILSLDTWNNLFWGGSGINRYFKAPFTSNHLGIDWEMKEILYTAEKLPSWGEVTHEMGHLFATDKDPRQADELAFFGWEYVLAKQIQKDPIDWINSNADYVLSSYDAKGSERDENVDFGKLPPTLRTTTLAHYVRHSTKLGLVKRGKPLKFGVVT